MSRLPRARPGAPLAGPALLAVALAGVVGAAWALGRHLGQGVHWPVGGAYGVILALSCRYPVHLPRGSRTASVGLGLLVACCVQYGLATALVAVAVWSGLYAWMGRRPQGWRSLLAGLWEAVAAAGGAWAGRWVPGLPTSLGAVVAAWAAGRALCAGPWGLWLRGGQPLLSGLCGTPWAPLVLWPVVAAVDAAGDAAPWAGVAVAAGAAGLQWLAAPVANTLIQDQAVAHLVRQVGLRQCGHPGLYERTLHYAYAIGRALELEEADLRLVAYACVLQDIGAGGPAPAAADLALDPPAGELAETLASRAQATAERVQAVGALAEVARILRYRYAWWDGRGTPPAAGVAIPLGAQVLAAATALARLVPPGASAEAVQEALVWVRAQTGRRLAPAVAQAAVRALEESALVPGDADRLIQDTIRRLQALGGPLTYLPAPLMRVLGPLRARLAGLVGLPEDLLAVTGLATLLGAHTDPGAVAAVVTDVLAQLTGGAAVLALAGEETGALAVRAARGLRSLDPVGEPLPVHAGPVARALVLHEPVELYGRDLETLGPLGQRLYAREGVRAALALPLVARGRAIGLAVVGLRQPYWLNPRRLGVLRLVAAQAALAVDNSRLLAQAEERLQRVLAMKRFTDLLIANLPAAVLAVDEGGIITHINPMAQSILERAGYGRLEVGMPMHFRLAGGPVVRALAGEEVTGCILEYAPDLVLDVRSAPLRDGQGRIVGALCLGLDISQLRAMERQLRQVERLAAVGQLAAGAAHEIRNPLTAVRGFLQLLALRLPPGSREAEYVQITLGELDRVDALIQDLLLLGRPAEPRREPVPLPALLDEVLLLLGEAAAARGVALVRDYAPGTPPAWGDPKLLKQVAHNLLRNAVEAAAGAAAPGVGGAGAGGTGEPGGPQVRVAVGARDSQVYFQVADNGPGIPAEQMDRLFTPFFTTKEGGTGLGLAISYALVSAHGGRIEVQSQPGAGAAFTVWLPAQPKGGSPAPGSGGAGASGGDVP